MSTLSVTNIFVAGTVIDPSQMNTNFANIVTWANGNIDDSNIIAAAGIAFSKLAKTTQFLVLRTAGTLTIGSGLTGDTQPRATFTADGGILFGVGGATAGDLLMKRLDANTIAIRDSADATDQTIRVSALKLRNTNVMTMTPAALGADRAVTVKDPGAAADLRFATGVFNAGGAVVTDGTNVQSTAAGTSGQVLTSNGAGAPTWQTAGGGGISQRVRLYGTTGNPTADAGTALTTLFVGPYTGNTVALYNTGTAQWVSQSFAETSFAVPATTDTIYNVYINSASSTTIAITTTAWTNDTTPGASNALTLLGGQYVLSSDNSKLFVGTFRTTSVSGQTQDDTSRRLVVSFINPLPCVASCEDATASWTYTSTTIRAANASSTDGTGRVAFLIPNAGRSRVSAVNQTIGSTSTAFTLFAGIGLDSTTAYSGFGCGVNTGGGVPALATSLYAGYPSSGYHYLSRLEASQTSTSTFYGTQTSIIGSGVPSKSGMYVELLK